VLEHDDLGETSAETRKLVAKYAQFVNNTSLYFLDVYDLKRSCFEDYAKYYGSETGNFDEKIRIRLWERYDDFLGDFQKRYQTKTIPGAFFGTIYPKDEYGKSLGPGFREIGTSTEGATQEDVLRHLYHEMGHLFMRTFMVSPVEVPSWIEEGTAQIFQFREGNGTKPKEEREQRQGWMLEMLAEGSAVPWAELIEVKNIDNLDFTWKDPLRSTIQYTQTHAVMQFMLLDESRRAAFKNLLKDFKKTGEQQTQEAQKRRLQGQGFHDFVSGSLYQVQRDTFKKHYGADVLAVEGRWKEWTRKTYEKEVKRNPILRYYRGDWWIGPRFNTAKTDEARKAAIASAEEIFNECVVQTPKLAEGFVGLGRVAMARGDFDGAMKQFAEAATLGSDNFETQLYGGIALLRSGDLGNAIASLTKAVKQRESSADANFQLGHALAMAGTDPVKATRHLIRARDLRADLAGEASVHEGMVHYKAGDLKKANIAFLRATTSAGGNPIPILALAIVKAMKNESEDALNLLAQAKDQGNPFAEQIAGIIKAGKELPKLGYSKRGMALVLGITIPVGEAPPEQPAPGPEAGKEPGKDAPKKPFSE
jgi:tetratricopeptide (TPR) repeat protein